MPGQMKWKLFKMPLPLVKPPDECKMVKLLKKRKRIFPCWFKMSCGSFVSKFSFHSCNYVSSIFTGVFCLLNPHVFPWFSCRKQTGHVRQGNRSSPSHWEVPRNGLKAEPLGGGLVKQHHRLACQVGCARMKTWNQEAITRLLIFKKVSL